MDVKDIATYGTAIAVVGTGTVVGGNTAIARYTGGPVQTIRVEQAPLKITTDEKPYKL